MSKLKWNRVDKRHRCPICEHPDWCSVSEDGKVCVCMRVESSRRCKSGGWFHTLTDDIVPDRRRLPKPKSKAKAVSRHDFPDLAQRYAEALGPASMAALSRDLGVSTRSLERLQVGWDGEHYTFPMSNGKGHCVGIRVRGKDGKWSVTGSDGNGLFWPDRVESSRDLLLICEGPTDCAALLDLDYAAIGRPSCSGGVEYVCELLGQRRRPVVIMADNDEWKTRPDGTRYRPGADGAKILCQRIKPLVRTLRMVKPPRQKDIRAWLRSGVTRAAVDVVINHARFL